MEHKDAVRLKAAEQYVLNELSPEVREQFEEHYFDCPECAVDVQAISGFATASRKVLAEDASKAPARKPEPAQQNWFAWLRPVIAIPAIAGLAAVVVFQAAVTIPKLKEQVESQKTAQIYESSYRVQGITRGEGVSKISVPPNTSFALDFDFTPSQAFPSYRGTLVDPAGQRVLEFHVSGTQANKELHFVIPAGKVQPGTYGLVFTGLSGASNADPSAPEVQRLAFAVEFRPE